METGFQTIGAMLLAGAERHPDREFVLFEDGSCWTWQQAVDNARIAASALAGRGIGPGKHLGIYLPNGADFLRAWWGTALLGGVFVPLNPAYRGAILEGVCERAALTTLVTSEALSEQLPGSVRDWFLCEELMQGAAIAEVRTGHFSDVHALIPTSGTTGLSKVSRATHAFFCHVFAWLTECEHGVTGDDTILADLPLFHISGLNSPVLALRTGSRIALRSAPSMSNYWSVIRQTGTTVAWLAGSMADFLLGQQAGEDDRDHGLRLVCTAPLPASAIQFQERFGVTHLVTGYGATESNYCIVNAIGTPLRMASCGKVRPGFEVRIVDDRDQEVATGNVGEAVVRSYLPWTMSLGYHGSDAATVSAWRNLWFHTGDAMRKDEDGYLFFVDRANDAIRRRGENVSSFEVEQEVLKYPGVRETACVPVRLPGSADDEVKIFIVGSADTSFPKLMRFLVERLPYFMVPRFYEQTEILPKTPTQKISKKDLRILGNGPATWDREEHGYFITRKGLTEPLPNAE